MAHYAILDDNNIVEQVIVGVDENELIDGLSTEAWYSRFFGKKVLRTSYNGNIRKNYAGIGWQYDQERDAFIERKPSDDFMLDEETCRWVPIASEEPQTT